MALFGNKRPDDFPIGLPGLMGGYGGGTFNPDGSAATPTISTPSGNDLGAMPAGLTLGATTPQPKKGGGLFGSNSALWKVMGAVGDAMSMSNGLPATFTPAMLAQRQHQQTMAEKEADRQAQFQNEVALARIKAADPGDDAFTRAMQAAGYVPGSPEYVALAKKRAESLTNPVQFMSDGMGGYIPVRPYGGDGSAPPTQPVGKITLIPGGGVGNGASGFRP